LNNNPSHLRASFPRTSYSWYQSSLAISHFPSETVVQLNLLFQRQFLPTPPASLFTFFLFFHLLQLGCGRLTTSQRIGPFAPSDSLRVREYIASSRQLRPSLDPSALTEPPHRSPSQ
ncbi:hypothetical protein CI238_01709, partial [Colletotrichum incanum]